MPVACPLEADVSALAEGHPHRRPRLPRAVHHDIDVVSLPQVKYVPPAGEFADLSVEGGRAEAAVRLNNGHDVVGAGTLTRNFSSSPH